MPAILLLASVWLIYAADRALDARRSRQVWGQRFMAAAAFQAALSVPW